MTKLREDPIEASDLLEYVRSQDDFDLELFVYRAAKEADAREVSHGGSYADPVTKKARQFDVRAAFERGDFRIDLAIECKALRRSYPLLVSRIPRTEDESFHEIIRAHPPPSGPYGMITPGLDNAEVVRVSGTPSLYPAGEFVGKSTAQVGRNERGELRVGDREVYDKWSQALASASDLISRAAWAHEERQVPSFFTLILPVLVVADGTLWVADYSDDGKLSAPPVQMEEATIFVDHVDGPHMGPSYTMTHLHVYTRRRVGEVLSELGQGGGIWPDRPVEDA